MSEPVSPTLEVKVSLAATSTPEWGNMRLHAWATIAALYGCELPTEPDDRTPDLDEPQRRAFMREVLALDKDGGVRVVAGPLGDVAMNDRLVNKIAQQPDRTPYVAWVPFAPTLAVEIWQKSEVSKATGIVELRNYYLVPLIGSKEHDGFVVITGEHDNVAFNVFPFKENYADTKLRAGACLHRSYPPEVLCSSGCCQRFLEDRRLAGELREQNRMLRLELKQLRRNAKGDAVEIERLKRSLKAD